MVCMDCNVRLNTSRVLVVSRNRESREWLATMLFLSGFHSIKVETGKQAVEHFRDYLPWLVITEVFSPDEDSISAVEQIKHLAGDIFVPTLFISHTTNDEVLQLCLDAGGDDFIQGPLTNPALVKAKLAAMQRISQLYHEVHGLHQLLQREEEIAEELLSGAIEAGNAECEKVRIYKRPASIFCGDVQLTAYRPNGDVNVLLGDFTGHGLTSVIGALPLSETFRAMTRKGYAGDDILHQINDKLKALLPTGMFLATIMVTISQDEGQAYVWNCGMPSVLVLSGSEKALKCTVESLDPPLGIVPGFKTSPARVIPLEENDRILLISDGVQEARNRAGDMFGDARLLAAAHEGMAKNQLADHVIAKVSQFMGNRVQDDDVSLIEIPGDVRAPLVPQNPLSKSMVDIDALEQHGQGWCWSIDLQGKSLSRINPVPMLLSQLQEMEGHTEHWQTVFTILTELYVNALDHGVLQLSSDLKASPEGFPLYYQEREAKLSALEQGYVRIALDYMPKLDGGQLRIRVEDSGDGFDYRHWLATHAEISDEQALSGRGIRLVSELVETLNYSDKGATVEVYFSW